MVQFHEQIPFFGVVFPEDAEVGRCGLHLNQGERRAGACADVLVAGIAQDDPVDLLEHGFVRVAEEEDVGLMALRPCGHLPEILLPDGLRMIGVDVHVVAVGHQKLPALDVDQGLAGEVGPVVLVAIDAAERNARPLGHLAAVADAVAQMDDDFSLIAFSCLFYVFDSSWNRLNWRNDKQINVTPPNRRFIL